MTPDNTISFEEARRIYSQPYDDMPREWPPDPAPGWEGPPEPEMKRAPLKSLLEFVREYQPLSYAIEPIIRTGSLYSLTAKTGAGKTAWIISAALAVASGRSDILNIEVEAGRVALLTFENPDDVRMRLMVAAFFFHIDVASISNKLVIIDMRVKPEAVIIELREAAERDQFRLIFVDTLAAFFDGDDANNNVQVGEFMRRLRPMTQIPGMPAVVVAAHPVKNASEEQLIPYGGGAILNEVDGNLTLWLRTDANVVKLHWQGKLRGLDFEAPEFRFETCSSPDVLDAKGRQVLLPIMKASHLTEADVDARAKAETNTRIAMLKAIQTTRGASYSTYGAAAGCSKTRAVQIIKELEKSKLAENALGGWEITPKGERELSRCG